MNNLIGISDNFTQSHDSEAGAREAAGEEVGEREALGRRGLLRTGGTAALAGAAAVLLRGNPAGASTGGGSQRYVANNPAAAVDTRQDGTGDGLYSHIENPKNPNRAVFGRTVGTGIAVVASVANENSNATASKGTTVGSGPGVEGSSRLGVGGKFSGSTAQIQLVPSLSVAHPGAGLPGQLFVDKASRLWFCRGGANWQQLA
jgi:hypothetical protein